MHSFNDRTHNISSDEDAGLFQSPSKPGIVGEQEASSVSTDTTNPAVGQGAENIVIRFDVMASRKKEAFQPVNELVPLVSGDHIRFANEFNEPVYARLIWADADGHPEEQYPSDPDIGHSGSDPVTKIESPEELESGWPLQGRFALFS